MAKYIVLAIALTFALPAIAKQGGHHSGSASSTHGATARKGGSGVHGHGSSHARDLRKAPDLDSARKVNVQDCTKPLDLEAGNLKCK